MTRGWRALAADAVWRGWQWASEVGTIGPNDRRGRKFQYMGPGSAVAFPPGAMFGERLIRIGAGTMIGPHVSLAAGMHPDEPLQVPGGVVISIGERCMIGRGNSIVGRCGIEIGDDVTTAPNVYITDHNHTYDDVAVPIGRQWLNEEPVRIGSGCWLGTGVVVLPGADIGRHVTVAAGSVVRGAIPDYSVIAGSPAKVVRQHIGEQGWVPPLRRPTQAPLWWVRDAGGYGSVATHVNRSGKDGG
jgi:acetyltransferase-like isoleucine patch superfamily enzyme